MRRIFFMALWLLVNVASGQEPVVPEDCKALGRPGGRAELACVVAKLQIQQQQSDAAINELRQQTKAFTQQVENLQKQRTQQADVAVKGLTQQVKALTQQVGDLEKQRKIDVAAKESKPKVAVTAQTRLPFEPEMVQITGGTFMMGSPEGTGESREHPQHEVTVGDFAIGKYEVTQGEWQAVMGSNPSSFSSCGERCPVEQVSWNDVQDYIAKLNAKTGKTYRLPTEAEWEYACRGGAVNDTYCGGNDLDSLAWHDGNSGDKTHPVGERAANGFGLFDMTGNVWEWNQDKWHGNYDGAPTDGTAWESGDASGRIRGCSWSNRPRYCPTAFRYRYSSGIVIVQSGNIGFRVVVRVAGRAD